VDPGEDHLQERLGDLAGRWPGGLLMGPGQGGRRRPINGQDEMERAPAGPHLGKVPVEATDRGGREPPPGGPVALRIRAPRDAAALKAAVWG